MYILWMSQDAYYCVLRLLSTFGNKAWRTKFAGFVCEGKSSLICSRSICEHGSDKEEMTKNR